MYKKTNSILEELANVRLNKEPENFVGLKTHVDSQSPGIVSDAAKSSW